MEIHTAEALILEVRDLADADRIVTFLTRHMGKKSGVAKGARRKHSRYAGQLQPLAKVALTWVEKAGRDLVRISQAETVRSVGKLQEDLDAILLGSYMADQAMEFIQENETSELPFRLLDSTLEALLAGVPWNLAMRFYESWMLRLAGVFPPPTECPSCGQILAAGAFLPDNGDALLCGECSEGMVERLKVSPEVVVFLLEISHRKLPELALQPPAESVLRASENLCAKVRRNFLQQELRSYRVLLDMRRQMGEI